MQTRGFTLIELLIVLVLISVMTGMAVLAIGNNGQDRTQWLEAKRLATLLNMAEQEAVLSGTAMAVEMSEHGYRFLRLGGSGWQIEHHDELFRSRSLQQDMRIIMFINGQIQYLPKDFISGKAAAPQILLAPDSMAEVVDIRIAAAERSISVTNGNPEGWAVAETGRGDYW